MSTESGTPKLLPHEWRAHFAAEPTRLLNDTPDATRDAIEERARGEMEARTIHTRREETHPRSRVPLDEPNEHRH